jgi:hypothetical protein
MDKLKEMRLAEAEALLDNITPDMLGYAIKLIKDDSAMAFKLLDKIRDNDQANRLMYNAYCQILAEEDRLPDPTNPEEFRKFEAAIAAMMTLVMLGYRIHEAQTASAVDLGKVN